MISMIRHRLRLLFAPLMLQFGCSGPHPMELGHFALYYGSEPLPPQQLSALQLLVLNDKSPIDPRQLPDTLTLGYVSVGEVHGYRRSQVADNAVIRKNPHWDSYLMDIRNKEWQELVIQLAREKCNNGYGGVMLDTLDSPLYLEETDQTRFKGMNESAVDIITAIRKAAPHCHIMVNRAFSLLPDIAYHIDSVLLESSLSNYNLTDGSHRLRAQSEYDALLTPLYELRQINPKLQFFAVDYWDMEDAAGVAEIYRVHATRGIQAYVATPDLGTLYLRPNHAAPN